MVLGKFSNYCGVGYRWAIVQLLYEGFVICRRYIKAYALVRTAKKGRWGVIPTAHYTPNGKGAVWKSTKAIFSIKE